MSKAIVLPSNLEDDIETTADFAVVASLPKRVRIILEENDNIPPTGQFFGVNGRTYMLQPGVPVEVPPELIDVLDHAIETISQIDDRTRRIIGTRQKHRYPYRRIDANYVV